MCNDVISKNLYPKKRYNLNMSYGTATFPPNPSLIREGNSDTILSLKHISKNISQGCKHQKICYNSDISHHKRNEEFMKKYCYANIIKCVAPIATCNRNRKAAFTLAEVLITLGIIGVVAVLTLSSVIQNIQNKQNIAKWKKEYSVINNAFNEVLAAGVSVCEAYSPNGTCASVDNNYIGNYSDEFIAAFQSKLKIIDYCSTTESNVPSDRLCDNYNYSNESLKKTIKYEWSGTASIYSRYRALGVRTESEPGGYVPYGINAYNFYRMALLLADGAVVYLGEVWQGPWIVVDVNNFTKGPNEFGKDVFVIHVTSNIRKNKHFISPAGAENIYDDRPDLNNPSYGITGCSKDIGKTKSNTVYEVAGTGCSAKYLME